MKTINNLQIVRPDDTLYGKCSNCGYSLPPDSAATHQCPMTTLAMTTGHCASPPTWTWFWVTLLLTLVVSGCGTFTENYLYKPDLLDRAMSKTIVNGDLVIPKTDGIDLTDADAVSYAQFVDKVLSAKLEADRALIITTELAKVGLYVGAQAVQPGLGMLLSNSSSALDLIVNKIIKPKERAIANLQGAAAIKRAMVAYYRARNASRRAGDTTPLISGKRITAQGIDLIDITYSTLNAVALANEQALPNPDDLSTALKMIIQVKPDTEVKDEKPNPVPQPSGTTVIPPLQ